MEGLEAGLPDTGGIFGQQNSSRKPFSGESGYYTRVQVKNASIADDCSPQRRGGRGETAERIERNHKGRKEGTKYAKGLRRYWGIYRSTPNKIRQE
jgi:hypothetical protein